MFVYFLPLYIYPSVTMACGVKCRKKKHFWPQIRKKGELFALYG